jgi:type IV pilus assembly protein PilC
LLVSAILLVFVVPQFEEVFANFGADLPAFTKLVIGISKFMVSWWWLIFLVVAGGIVGVIMAKKRSPAFQHFLDRVILKVPVLGKIMHESALARFSRTLAVTFAAGVPLVEALDSVAGATGNTVYEKAVLRVRDDVAVGYQVNMAMKQTGLFPHMVVQMTAIGEEAGALDTMLYKVAEFYEQEVNNAVDALASLLEPLIVVMLGVIVGSMVVAMYLPIFKLAAVV